MKQIRCIDSQEMIGKTIKSRLVSDDSLALVFTDGEIFQAYAYGDEENSYFDDVSFFQPDYFNVDELAEVFADHADVMEYVDQRRAQYAEKMRKAKESQDMIDRADYLRLKARFEPQQPASTETPIA